MLLYRISSTSHIIVAQQQIQSQTLAVPAATMNAVWWKMHRLHPQSVSSLVSLFMRFSDMMPFPLGAEKLEIPWPPCVKPLPPRRVKLSGGPADSDKLTMAECSTSHLQPFSGNAAFFSSIVRWAGEREDKGWLRKITLRPSKDILHEDTWVNMATFHYRFAEGSQGHLEIAALTISSSYPI